MFKKQPWFFSLLISLMSQFFSLIIMWKTWKLIIEIPLYYIKTELKNMRFRFMFIFTFNINNSILLSKTIKFPFMKNFLWGAIMEINISIVLICTNWAFNPSTSQFFFISRYIISNNLHSTFYFLKLYIFINISYFSSI